MSHIGSRTARAVAAALALAFAGQGEAATPETCRGAQGFAADFEGRRTFLWRPSDLSAIRARWSDDPALAPARRVLLDQAEAAMTAGPWTVIDKTRLPPSGDPHDYASLAPYWWPDDGPDRPYVRHDGQVNPERHGDAWDSADFTAMSDAVEVLALAHFHTGERRYAERAALMVRTWFLDPGTRMNPNLNFAQGVPGVSTGRPFGIIDAHRLTGVVEAIGLLEGAGVLAPADMAGLRDWFGRMVDWLTTSPMGVAESETVNNHSLHYDLMVTHFALFAGREAVAREVVGRYPERRLAVQVAADGSLPEELSRTRSFHYSTWSLIAVHDMATLSECLGVDLRRHRLADGRGIERATAFIAAYAGRETEWPWPETRLTTTSLYGVLVRAARGYGDPELAARAAVYAEREAANRINLIIAQRPPPD